MLLTQHRVVVDTLGTKFVFPFYDDIDNVHVDVFGSDIIDVDYIVVVFVGDVLVVFVDEVFADVDIVFVKDTSGVDVDVVFLDVNDDASFSMLFFCLTLWISHTSSML